MFHGRGENVLLRTEAMAAERTRYVYPTSGRGVRDGDADVAVRPTDQCRNAKIPFLCLSLCFFRSARGLRHSSQLHARRGRVFGPW